MPDDRQLQAQIAELKTNNVELARNFDHILELLNQPQSLQQSQLLQQLQPLEPPPSDISAQQGKKSK